MRWKGRILEREKKKRGLHLISIVIFLEKKGFQRCALSYKLLYDILQKFSVVGVKEKEEKYYDDNINDDKKFITITIT